MGAVLLSRAPSRFARWFAPVESRACAARHPSGTPCAPRLARGSTGLTRRTCRCTTGATDRRKRDRERELEEGTTVAMKSNGRDGRSARVRRREAVAIVTGGSVGAGREIARGLASWGWAIVVVYLEQQRRTEAT